MGNNNSKVTLVTEGATVEIGGETLLKLPADNGGNSFYARHKMNFRPSPSDLFDLVLEKITLADGFKFDTRWNHKFIKDIRLSDIRENRGFSSGSFLGVQINGYYNTNPLRVMVKKDRTINITQILSKVARLQKDYDFLDSQRQKSNGRYMQEQNRRDELEVKLNDQYGSLSSDKAHYEFDVLRNSLKMKLVNLTDKQIIYVADLVTTWNKMDEPVV